MEERTKAAFAAAEEASKQMLTIAAAVVGLGITFRQQLTSASGTHWTLGFALGFYLFASVAGVWSLLALTGALGSDETRPPAKQIQTDELSIYLSNIKWPFRLQAIGFMLALLFTAAYAFVAFASVGDPERRYVEAHRELASGGRCFSDAATGVSAAEDLPLCLVTATGRAFRRAPPPRAVWPSVDSIYSIASRSRLATLDPDSQTRLANAFWTTSAYVDSLSRAPTK